MFKKIFFLALILGLALGVSSLMAEEKATLQVPGVTTEKTSAESSTALTEAKSDLIITDIYFSPNAPTFG